MRRSLESCRKTLPSWIRSSVSFLSAHGRRSSEAGYDPATYDGPIGVYAGAYLDTYLLANLCSRPSALAELVQSIQVGTLQTELGNDKDYLATRVSLQVEPARSEHDRSVGVLDIARGHRPGLPEPGDVSVRHGAGRWRDGDRIRRRRAIDYQEDGMLSPDGHCRPFDARAQGTVFSNGLGVVVLKRLADAIADRDDVDRRDPRLGAQQRRRIETELHRAERRRTGRRHRDGPRDGRC